MGRPESMKGRGVKEEGMERDAKGEVLGHMKEWVKGKQNGREGKRVGREERGRHEIDVDQNLLSRKGGREILHREAVSREEMGS